MPSRSRGWRWCSDQDPELVRRDYFVTLRHPLCESFRWIEKSWQTKLIWLKDYNCVTIRCSFSIWHWAHVLVQFHDKQHAACQRVSEPETHWWHGRELPALRGVREVCRNDRNGYIISALLSNILKDLLVSYCRDWFLSMLSCSSEKGESDIFGNCSQSRTHSRKF